MTPKSDALKGKKVSMAEIKAKFAARHGGREAMGIKAQETRNKIQNFAAKNSGNTPSSKEQSDYQKRTGRGYNE